VTTYIVLVFAMLLAVAAGAALGRWLALREVWREIGEVLDTAAASAGRANFNSAKIERIANDWPGVVARVEKLDADVLRFIPRTQEAERQAAAVQVRMQELEQAVAANFGITLTKGA
jgi:outer membrane murein-binding lipoprotein Lpp